MGEGLTPYVDCSFPFNSERLPKTVEDIVEFAVMRLLEALGILDALPEGSQYTGPDTR